MRVAALIPAYQAAHCVGEVLLRLRALDDPPEVLSFAGNRGKGHALLAGFALLRTEFDAVVTLDADGQHPPECLPDFVRAAEAGADLVLGRRARTPDMPASRRFANAFSSGWATGLAGQRVSDSQCGYRLHGRALLERTPLTPGRYEVETELVVRAARLGFRLAEVEIPTVYGEAKSQIHALRDVPRIVGTLARLTAEAVAPPAAMRAARAGEGAR